VQICAERKRESWRGIKHRAGGIRTHDLLNPIQAFYQAELRPEVVEEHCLFVKNREKQLPIILGATCRRGERTIKLCYGQILLQTIH
jgi:hypothetical protein